MGTKGLLLGIVLLLCWPASDAGRLAGGLVEEHVRIPSQFGRYTIAATILHGMPADAPTGPSVQTALMVWPLLALQLAAATATPPPPESAPAADSAHVVATLRRDATRFLMAWRDEWTDGFRAA